MLSVHRRIRHESARQDQVNAAKRLGLRQTQVLRVRLHFARQVLHVPKFDLLGILSERNTDYFSHRKHTTSQYFRDGLLLK